ncbi:MAG TPA: DUF192 domain-containing protein [Candidatus Saccharimonadales bacterium]|nr:DUF192 domain-containing protein [Candidatus Saccharimonadales bacterium]
MSELKWLKRFNWRPLLVVWFILLVVIWTTWPRGPHRVLQVGNRMYKLELVTTPEDMVKGLGGRGKLAGNAGMLFAYDQSAPNRCFWMKDMHFSIDILWLDAYKRAVHIEQSVSPKTYPKEFCAPQASQYVIELHEGEAKKAKISIGQTLNF